MNTTQILSPPAFSASSSITSSGNLARWHRIAASSLALVAASMFGFTARAQAQVPPPLPLVEFGLQAQSTFASSAGLISSGAFSASGGTTGNGPVVSIHGDGPRSIVTDNNMASAQALWAFEIVGPAGVVVPILISGLYSASASSGESAIASGGVALGQDRFRLTRILSFRCQSGDESGCDSANGNRPHAFQLASGANSNALTFLQIVVGGVVQPLPGMLGQFDAYVDPIITIDPSFARLGEFTLFVSPDAYGNVGAVPEPQTHALLLAGLVLLAATARRGGRRPGWKPIGRRRGDQPVQRAD